MLATWICFKLSLFPCKFKYIAQFHFVLGKCCITTRHWGNLGTHGRARRKSAFNGYYTLSSAKEEEEEDALSHGQRAFKGYYYHGTRTWEIRKKGAGTSRCTRQEGQCQNRTVDVCSLRCSGKIRSHGDCNWKAKVFPSYWGWSFQTQDQCHGRYSDQFRRKGGFSWEWPSQRNDDLIHWRLRTLPSFTWEYLLVCK